MARIRTIKPEFFQSETLGSIDRSARLCFSGLITIADDEGRMRAAPKFLAGTLFSFDDDARDKIGDWLDALERIGNIERYEVEGSKYLAICNWRKHQKIDKPSASRLPAPPSAQGKIRDASARTREPSPDLREPSPRPREGSTKVSEDPDEAREASEPDPRSLATDLGPGTSDHGPGGGSGTSNQVPSTSHLESDPVRQTERAVSPKRSRIAYSADFEEFWRGYPTSPNMSKADTFKVWKITPAEEREAATRSLPNYCDGLRNRPDHPVIHAERYLKKRRAEGMLEATPEQLAAPPDTRRRGSEPRENPHFAVIRRNLQEAANESDRQGGSFLHPSANPDARGVTFCLGEAGRGDPAGGEREIFHLPGCEPV